MPPRPISLTSLKPPIVVPGSSPFRGTTWPVPHVGHSISAPAKSASISSRASRFVHWNVICIDGHQVEEISDAVDEAASVKGRPTVILARTIKGKGVSFMEGKSAWHGKPISADEYVNAMKELEAGV